MSRPSLPPVQRRSRTVGVRVSRPEWDTLVARAAAAGQRPSAYIRAAALARVRPAREAAEVASVEDRRELRRIGNNLNQVARQLHGWRTSSVVRTLLSTLADLQQRIGDRAS